MADKSHGTRENLEGKNPEKNIAPSPKTPPPSKKGG